MPVSNLSRLSILFLLLLFLLMLLFLCRLNLSCLRILFTLGEAASLQMPGL